MFRTLSNSAAQFTWNRERNVDFAAYMGAEGVLHEEEEDVEEHESQSSRHESLSESMSQVRQKLNTTDTGQNFYEQSKVELNQRKGCCSFCLQ